MKKEQKKKINEYQKTLLSIAKKNPTAARIIGPLLPFKRQVPFKCPKCKKKLFVTQSLAGGPYSGVVECKCGYKSGTMQHIFNSCVVVEPLPASMLKQLGKSE